ncbi:MAG: HPr family phosphocarrier protein [Phycisphaeraceae bacterium]
MNQPTPSSSDLGPTSGGDANGHRAEAVVVIRNRLGMHARPAMSFVDTASQFSASIQVIKNQQSVDAKSIMQLMMLAATQGTELKVIAEGTDAQEAVTAIEDLVNRGFDED